MKVTSVELRRSLAKFLGDERFRKFIRAGVDVRMLYWQERELDRFRDANPELEFELSDLAVALRVCEVHESDLHPCSVGIFRGHLTWTQDYVDAKRATFPHAALGPVMVSDDFPGDSIDGWYCPECRNVENEWRTARR